MPFQKGTQAWRKGLLVKRENQNRVSEFIGAIVDGHFEDYVDKLEELHQKKDLTKAEHEFMDRFERLFEYAAPKLALKEVTGEGGGPLQVSLIQFKDLK